MTDSHYTSQRVWDPDLEQFLDPVTVMTSVLAFHHTEHTEAVVTERPEEVQEGGGFDEPCDSHETSREADAASWEFLATEGSEEEEWDDLDEFGGLELDMLDEDPGTEPGHVEVALCGQMDRERLLTRFLDQRLGEWGFDGSVVAHFMDMLWSSGNHHATWRALRGGLERGLDVHELYWVHEVRGACRERFGLELGWACLFGVAESFSDTWNPDTFAHVVDQCHEFFEEDLSRTRRWYHVELEDVDREEGHGCFWSFMESMFSRLSPELDPCHWVETMGELTLDAPGRRFEHEAWRPDHVSLAPGSRTFERLLATS